MDEKQLQALAYGFAKNLKTPEDLNQFDRMLKKISDEAALNAEMTHHLGHEKYHPKSDANSRNGYSSKTVSTTDGPPERFCRIKESSGNILFSVMLPDHVPDPKSLQSPALPCRYYCPQCPLVSGLLTEFAQPGRNDGRAGYCR